MFRVLTKSIQHTYPASVANFIQQCHLISSQLSSLSLNLKTYSPHQVPDVK